MSTSPGSTLNVINRKQPLNEIVKVIWTESGIQYKTCQEGSSISKSQQVIY